MNIFVAGLNYSTSEDQLRDLFEQYGGVDSVKIIMDRETGRSKGFGFVEMEDDDAAREAIENLNEFDFEGRSITVKEARPREERPRRNDFGRGGGGGYGRGGGGGYNRGGGGGYNRGGGGGYNRRDSYDRDRGDRRGGGDRNSRNDYSDFT